MTNNISEWSKSFLISAASYGALFYANDWLTSTLVYGLGVNWIYLPAGLRLFLTLVFALPGALGIAVASMLICWLGDFPQDLVTCIGIGLVSGFAPYIARIFVLANLPISADLSDLSLPKLLMCILIYAFLSSGMHQWWFAIRGLDNTGSLNHFFVMFIGDVLGTILLIAVIKYGLDLLKKTRTIAL
ncbi:MAG: hypothetical protein WCH33_05680 [Betaproteobacteria bacterium]|jgi:hypothetical protein|uniref:hypothetical protein n=1 Tax=Polynucleobacter finlandensis TaxID=1855894 RepID=UPI001C0E0D65|nr:hypothetical protein [Polynucleobacter finlandensis]MBU3544147.1 hypothetical protein [Polynucleobacter finlandensis]